VGTRPFTIAFCSDLPPKLLDMPKSFSFGATESVMKVSRHGNCRSAVRAKSTIGAGSNGPGIEFSTEPIGGRFYLWGRAKLNPG